jgi:hypothetical protein
MLAVELSITEEIFISTRRSLLAFVGRAPTAAVSTPLGLV